MMRLTTVLAIMSAGTRAAAPDNWISRNKPIDSRSDQWRCNQVDGTPVRLPLFGAK